MFSNVKTVVAVLVFSGLLAACSSTPTWSGMSESDIAGWKALGLDAAGAQKYVKEGFDLAAATPWVTHGFDAETAGEWAEYDFSADEAAAWLGGDFDLDEARKNREKGLTPVQ